LRLPHAIIARALALFAALVMLSATLSFAGAGAPADPGEQVVRRLIDSIRKLRTTTDSAQRTALVTSLDKSLALRELCAQAVGAQWSKLSGAERDRFVSLVTRLLEKIAYPRAAEFFSGLEVQFVGADLRGPRDTVRTAVKQPKGGQVSIDYVLARFGSQWRITDVILDRQSLAATVAAQIQAVLNKGSYNDLMSQLEARLKQAGS
jgi:ABC-type transporter MlaC component